MESIYNYVDPIKYIEDFISYKRKTDAEFSLKKWSSELGFSSHVGFIEVLKGKKNLRPAVVDTIIDKIGLDKSEYPYFLTLVAKSRTSNELEEHLYDLFMAELSPATEKPFTVKRFVDSDIFSHWIFTTILALAELKNFEMTASNIKNSLREELPVEIIQAALERLLDLGLMEIDSNNKAVLKQDMISTENGKKHPSVRNYFEQVADMSKKAIDLPLALREMQSFSLPLSNDQIPLAKDIIRKCRNNLTALSQNNADVVYQMNMSLFPLTKEKDS